MVISIRKKADELKQKGPDLLTRPVGRLMYQSIRAMLEHIREGETLVLDFQNIKVIDSSFIDEMIVRLVLDSRNGEIPFYVKLKNISEIAEINIDMVFRSYSNYKNKKIVVLTENICQNNAFFIGPLSDREREIVEFLRINKSITQEDIVKYTGSPTGEVAGILEGLDALRVIKKENTGFFSRCDSLPDDPQGRPEYTNVRLSLNHETCIKTYRPRKR